MNILTIYIVVLFSTISLKVKFDNAVLRFLGTISLKLYLVHNVFIIKLSDKGFDVWPCVCWWSASGSGIPLVEWKD